MPKNRKLTYSDHQADKQRKQPKKTVQPKRQDSSQPTTRDVRETAKD
jgi:hypothetical protein